MNPYLKHLNKIEFVVTDACTGRCQHCSQGDHPSCGGGIDPTVASEAVRRIGSVYPIETVMTFGGEPLLYPKTVCAIMNAAREVGVPHRQVITNGYFTKKADHAKRVAAELATVGVNDLLLSADAFHQKNIPVEAVMQFARAAQDCGIPMRLQPAWLVSRTDDNPYNRGTREILSLFDGMGIPVGEGNIIFPEGNALKYLAEYFGDELPENPYVEDPKDVRCVSFSANGDVLNGNVYERDVMEILKAYHP